MIYIDIYSTRAVIRSQEPLTVGLAGGQAHFRFSDRWKNLTKTVVFRQGDITKDVVGVTSGAVIPHEVLKVPGVPVEIGVYGSDGEGKIIIPTVWVATDPVLEGADPMVDASADPTLPVYQQIEAQVEVNRAQIEKNTPFTVEISMNDAGGYEANTSLNGILSVWHSGRPIAAKYGERMLPLVRIDNKIAQFCSVHDRTAFMASVTDTDVKYSTRFVADDATVTALEKTVSDLQKTATQHTIKLNAQQNAIDGHTDRLDKLEAGGVGGGSGVHIGTEPPVDDSVSLWVNPEGDAESEDAAYHDQTVTVEEAANGCTLNFPCPIADFHELHIHMTGGNTVSQLYMEAGGESTYLIAPQHGATSGTHIHLMATHERDTMNMDATTAAYSENAQPGVPLGTAGIGNEAASLRLYSKDGGNDLLPGMEIRAWGVYKTQGCGTLKVRNPETGEWESLKTLQGENGKDGSDYVLTDADKQEIAEQAAGLVDVPEYELPVASPDALGGVQPVEKTEEMTNPVGVDALGGLWSAGGSDSFEQIFSLTAEENIYNVRIPVEGAKYKYLCLRINAQAWDPATEAIYSDTDMIAKGVIRADSATPINGLTYGGEGKYTTTYVLFFRTGLSAVFVPIMLIPSKIITYPGALTSYNPMTYDYTVRTVITISAHEIMNKYLFTAGSTFELWGVRK